VIEPTAEVACCPVKTSIPSSTLPQPFSPQSRVPQPGLNSTVIDPTDVVACCPERVIVGASP